MSRPTLVDPTEGPAITPRCTLINRGGSWYTGRHTPKYLASTYADDHERPDALYPTLGIRAFRNLFQPTTK